jgi:hypothetical protein
VRYDSFDPLPGPFVPTILLSPSGENPSGQTFLFFLEPFSFVDAKSMQLPVRYHAGAHLTGALAWVFATVTQLPHPSVFQSS